MSDNWAKLLTPQFWIGIVVSLICIILLLTQVPLNEIIPNLSKGNYYWIMPAIAFQLISILFRTWRWHFLLRAKATFWTVFWAQGVGYLFTNVFPLRLGEPARILMLSQKSGISIVETTTTAVIERVYDLATVIFFMVIILPLMDVSDSILQSGLVLGILVIVAFILMLLAANFPTFFTGIIQRLLSPFPKIKDIILPIWQNTISGLETVKSWQSILSLSAISVMSWGASILAYWAGIRVFASQGNLIEATFMVVAISLAITVPSSPGFLGVFQFVAERALVIPFGDKYDSAIALSIALVTYLVYYFVSTVIGFIGIWQFDGSIKDLLNNILNRSKSNDEPSIISDNN